MNGFTKVRFSIFTGCLTPAFAEAMESGDRATREGSGTYEENEQTMTDTQSEEN